MTVLCNATFESGNLTGTADSFDSTSGVGISVTAAAALASTGRGVQFLINSTANRYGNKNFTPGTNQVRYRFYFDPNSIVMANNDSFEIHSQRLSASPYSLCAISLTYLTASGYGLTFDYGGDAGWVASSSRVVISDAPHLIEVQVVRATTNVASNGQERWWIDGVLASERTNIDNYDSFALWSGVFLGPDYALDAGTSGTIYYDELKANDDGSLIGPLPQPLFARPHILGRF